MKNLDFTCVFCGKKVILKEEYVTCVNNCARVHASNFGIDINKEKENGT